MNDLKISAVALVLLSFGSAAWAEDSIKTGQRGAPPPEAYAACEGKAAGDASVLVTPWGEAVEGVCVVKDGRLFLKPTRHVKSKKRGGGKPPQEAFKACDGLSEGDSVRFISSKGHEIRGVCRMVDGALAVVPEGKMESKEGM